MVLNDAVDDDGDKAPEIKEVLPPISTNDDEKKDDSARKSMRQIRNEKVAAARERYLERKNKGKTTAHRNHNTSNESSPGPSSVSCWSEASRKT